MKASPESADVRHQYALKLISNPNYTSKKKIKGNDYYEKSRQPIAVVRIIAHVTDFVVKCAKRPAKLNVELCLALVAWLELDSHVSFTQRPA